MRRTMLAILCAFAVIAPLAAEATKYPGLFRQKLGNGLEVFVYEEPEASQSRIEILFRGGAAVQSAETAGYFHLFEHLVFRGHGSPGSPIDPNGELARIGVTEWDGESGAEALRFRLSLPSDRTEEGLQFWAGHFMDEGAIDPEALETEKKNIAEEIRASASDPDAIYEAAITKRLFGKYPWRLDPTGSEKAITAATPAALNKLRNTWLIPNNAAIFVAGAVQHEAVFAEAAEVFASWKAGANPWKTPLPVHPKPGVSRPSWIVYPDASIPAGVATVEVRYRGPDLLTDPASSYAAELWAALVASPEGRFKKAIAKETPKLYGTDPITVLYEPRRESGVLSLSANFITDPAKSAVDRARQFKERARAFEITTMMTTANYYSGADYDAARRRVLDARDLANGTMDGIIDSLAFHWASASVDYFIDYPEPLAKTATAAVNNFLSVYILRNLEVVALRMNPVDYDKEKRSFTDSGFELVKPENSFWWQGK